MAKKTIIDYLEDLEIYVDTLKLAPLSPKKIYVDKEELLMMINEVKLRIPGEMQRSLNIVKNKDEILDSAREEADAILLKARNDALMMIGESDIVQEAQKKAEELLAQTRKACESMLEETQAYTQNLLAQAKEEAKEIRTGALYYTADTLGDIEKYIKRTIEENAAILNNLNVALTQSMNVILANRAEIDQQIEVFQQAEALQQVESLQRIETVQQMEAETGLVLQEESKDFL